MSKLTPHAAEIQSLYESGTPSTHIAKKFGVTPPVVLALLRKLGVTVRPLASRRPHKDMFNDEQVREIERRIGEGEDLASIGRAMGSTQTTIDRYAKRLGLHKPRKDLTSHSSEIVNALTSGTPVDEVADKYQTTRATIYSVVDRAGIDLLPITIMRRAAARPAPEVLQRQRWQHEKQRMDADPSLREAFLQKNKRVHDKLDNIQAPSMAIFRQGGCVKCGETRTPALDAHHLDPYRKSFEIGKRNRLRLSPSDLQQELSKCICICAYCHRVLHYEQGDNYRIENPKSKTAKQVVLARVRLQPVFDNFYAGGCWVCKRSHPAGLSAHHIDSSTKSFNVSRAFSLRLSNDLLEKELAKCACLCESCHRLVHANDLQCPTAPISPCLTP